MGEKSWPPFAVRVWLLPISMQFSNTGDLFCHSLKYTKQLPSVTHPAISCSSASHPGGDFFFFQVQDRSNLLWCVLCTWVQAVIPTVLTPGGLASPQLSSLLGVWEDEHMPASQTDAHVTACRPSGLPSWMWHDCSKGKAVLERTLEQ